VAGEQPAGVGVGVGVGVPEPPQEREFGISKTLLVRTPSVKVRR